MATTTSEKASLAGEVRCLGLGCDKKFWSPDKTRIRFCTKCRSKRNSASDSMSRIEMRLMSGGSGHGGIKLPED